MKKLDLQKNAISLKKTAATVEQARKDAALSAKNNAIAISNKMKKIAYKNKMKKYRPVFPNDFISEDFNLPNVIIIVDDAVRKDISVCKGAIGWLSTQKGVEILHLYDEAIEFSKINFIPTAICDTIYYVDPHNRNNFINTECYFSHMQKEKLAELQNIAYLLGAKKYSVEIIESKKEKSDLRVEATEKDSYTGISNEAASENNSSNLQYNKSLAHATFLNERKPSVPKLIWFAYDDNIKNLISMCCSQEEKTLSQITIELSNSNSATMSTLTAAKIDSAIYELGASSKFNKQIEEEYNHKMIYKIEF